MIYRSPELPPAPAAAYTPELRAAIAQREAQILAEVQAKSLAAVAAQHEAGAAKRIEAIEQRIFNQVASVGGIRNGRS